MYNSEAGELWDIAQFISPSLFCKIWMLLFSDILLLTRRHGKILSSIESPISLDNLLVQDINCTEGEPPPAQ